MDVNPNINRFFVGADSGHDIDLLIVHKNGERIDEIENFKAWCAKTTNPLRYPSVIEFMKERYPSLL